MSFLEKIRSLPEEERIKILWFLVVLFFLIILFVWVSNFNLIVLGSSEVVDSDTQHKKENPGIAPMDLLFTKIDNTFESTKNLISNFSLIEKKEVFERVK